MTINPKVDVLAVGSTSVRLLDIPTGRKKKLDATFAGGVGALEYSQCGCYLACSGTGSREVLLFDIQSTGPSEPICVVPVSGMPVKLSARSRKEHLEVLCIFENSDACVIVCKTNAMAGKDAVPYSVSGVRTGGQVLSGYFKPSKKTSSEACEVVLAVGSLHKPQFKTVAYTTESGDLISSVDIGMENGHGMNGASRQHEEGISDAIATVLGPHEAASKKRPRVDSVSSETETSSAHMAKDKNSDKKSKKTKAQSDDSLDAEGDDAIDGVQRFDLASHLSQAGVMTMEERLENLSGALMTATGRAANGDHAADAEADGAEADTAGAEGTTTAEKPTSDSLVVLIEQALQARDDSLLEHCLSCDDRDVLEATAARLSVNRVVPFLRHLVAKFEKRPARAHLVTHWVHALLRHHTAYLINNAEHATQLAGLSQMMEQRMSTFNSLTVLGGRLDLLMHQAAATHPSTNAQSRSASGSTSNGNGMKQNWSKPMQVFRAE
jgi:U3 small nucleolar RNA-associated protein 5